MCLFAAEEKRAKAEGQKCHAKTEGLSAIFFLRATHVHKIACPFSHYRRAHACGTAAASDWGTGTLQKRPEASPLATAGFSKNTPTAGEEK